MWNFGTAQVQPREDAGEGSFPELGTLTQFGAACEVVLSHITLALGIEQVQTLKNVKEAFPLLLLLLDAWMGTFFHRFTWDICLQS